MSQLLYISNNNGSDTRIVKEIKSLSKYYDVIYVGILDIGEKYDKVFVKKYCNNVNMVRGKRNNIITYIKQYKTILSLLHRYNIKSLHIINEKMLIIYYCIALKYNTILDLFDSIFLINNVEKNKLKILKKIIYCPANKIIVTDDNRYDLMPDFVKNKTIVLPNYPKKAIFPKKEKKSILTILYFGWLAVNRGTEIIEGLIKTRKLLKIIMAGWFGDKYTKSLVNKYSDIIEYKGVLEQAEIQTIGAKYADYILCVYAPINKNNINASPNKIYDAIHMNTPIIINSEVKTSVYIKNNNIGYIINNYYTINYNELYDELVNNKDKYCWDDNLKMKCSWENVENILINAHKINNNV